MIRMFNAKDINPSVNEALGLNEPLLNNTYIWDWYKDRVGVGMEAYERDMTDAEVTQIYKKIRELIPELSKKYNGKRVVVLDPNDPNKENFYASEGQKIRLFNSNSNKYQPLPNDKHIEINKLVDTLETNYGQLVKNIGYGVFKEKEFREARELISFMKQNLIDLEKIVVNIIDSNIEEL